MVEFLFFLISGFLHFPDCGETKVQLSAFLTPDIRLDGEGVVREAFGCSPLDGELGSGVGGVSVACHQPAQAEVSNLDHMILADQAVPSSEIPEGRERKH